MRIAFSCFPLCTRDTNLLHWGPPRLNNAFPHEKCWYAVSEGRHPHHHKNHQGKPEDIFCPIDLADIMVHVSKFIETVIRRTAMTNIMVVATLDYIKKYFGARKTDTFFQSGKLNQVVMQSVSQTRFIK